MNKKLEIFEVGLTAGLDAQLLDYRKQDGITTAAFRFTWTPENAAADDTFRVAWTTPDLRMMYAWSPLFKERHHLGPDWGGYENAMVSCNAPVYALYDGRGLSHITWQLSECRMLTFMNSGVKEENGLIENAFRFGVRQYTNQLETEITVRIDERVLPLYETLKAAAAWWETACDMTPAFVPADAKDPCYSFWYSYHQEVYAADVEAECARARALGFRACIIDDGWQTDDNSRGYAFCGEWQVAPAKIPDMAAHVAKVHELGMTYILWYAVPLIGIRCPKYEEFKDMLLNTGMIERLNCAVLDPRYKKVRDFLIDIYVTALKEWKLDGFKLDFIDTWHYSPDNAPYKEGMDIASLENAAVTFMQDLNAALKAVKPDVLLEFRQGYIGPVMRMVGNMFRVGDCPADYISNRLGVFDLRVMMGQTAVHSDMLMWHPDEAPEIAALQMISVLYSVIQYSARLDRLTPEMEKMSVFWLKFARMHKEALLGTGIRTYEPHMNYTWAESMTEEENVAAVYGVDKVIAPVVRPVIYIANGAENGRVLAELPAGRSIRVYDCFGNVTADGLTTVEGLNEIPVSVGGLVEVRA